MVDRADIRDGMQLISSDGAMMGTVDGGVVGERIKLRRAARLGGGNQHYVPLTWVSRIDDHVHVDRNAELVGDTWHFDESARLESGAPAETKEAKSKIVLWVVGMVLAALVIYYFVRP